MKPCEKYAEDLPCCTGDQCEGVVNWELRAFKTDERQRYKLHAMRSCPWIEKVRDWWRKNKSRGRDEQH
jgi:hypothetical protein